MMWRLMPLSKMVLRMIVFGFVLKAGELLLMEGLPWFGGPPPGDYAARAPMMAKDGLLLGLALGISMAVYAGILHRHVHKPALFHLALAIVGLTASLLLVQFPFHLSYLLDQLGPLSDWIDFLRYEPWMVMLFGLTIAKHAAIGLMSLYAASRYLQDASASFQKSRVQTLA